MLRVGQEKLKLEQDMTTDEGECLHTNCFRPTGHRKRKRMENRKCLLSPFSFLVKATSKLMYSVGTIYCSRFI